MINNFITCLVINLIFGFINYKLICHKYFNIFYLIYKTSIQIEKKNYKKADYFHESIKNHFLK